MMHYECVRRDMTLRIILTKKSDKEIIEMEAQYKNRFLTREFGLNAN